MNTKKQGISLVVLIITIIVIIILATAVIQSFSGNNPINKAKEAKFKNDVKTIQENYELAKINKYFDGTEDEEIMINDLTDNEEYRKKFEILDGKVVLKGNEATDQEKEWAKDLNIVCGYIVEDKYISNGVLNFYNGTGTNFPNNVGTDVIVPEKVTTIGDSAFYGTNITSISLPSTLETIQGSAFSGTKITSISLPSNLETIDAYAFSGCTSLKNVDMQYGLKSIGENAFQNCTSLTSLALPSSVTSLGNSVFYGCTNISSITGLRTTSAILFTGCTSLKKITLEEGLTSICGGTFMNSSLEEIILPNTIKTIGGGAFSTATKLKSITIPSGVQTFSGQNAFENCTSLKTMIIEGTPRFSKSDLQFQGIDTDTVSISGTGYKG